MPVWLEPNMKKMNLTICLLLNADVMSDKRWINSHLPKIWILLLEELYYLLADFKRLFQIVIDFLSLHSLRIMGWWMAGKAHCHSRSLFSVPDWPALTQLLWKGSTHIRTMPLPLPITAFHHAFLCKILLQSPTP